MKDLIFSNKALDCKVLCHKFKITPRTKIETYKIELDKIIDGFIKESRKTFKYSENKLLQKLCIDLSYLKTVLKDEEKEEIVREIILNENLKYDFNNEIHYFLKLVNKYTDKVREYTKNKLENESKDILKCENKPKNIKKFENILKNEKFQKKYFRAGQYMTVGYLEFENIDDCKDKIKILQYALNLLLKGCVKIFV